MPRPELLERNIALGKAFEPLGAAEMQSLRASIDESRGVELSQFFAHHHDA